MRRTRTKAIRPTSALRTPESVESFLARKTSASYTG